MMFDKEASSIKRRSITIKILRVTACRENFSNALLFNRSIVTLCPSRVNDGKRKYCLKIFLRIVLFKN